MYFLELQGQSELVIFYVILKIKSKVIFCISYLTAPRSYGIWTLMRGQLTSLHDTHTWHEITGLRHATLLNGLHRRILLSKLKKIFQNSFFTKYLRAIASTLNDDTLIKTFSSISQNTKQLIVLVTVIIIFMDLTFTCFHSSKENR